MLGVLRGKAYEVLALVNVNISMFDTIKLSKSAGYLERFMENRELPLIFSDSKSALALSESAVVTKRSKHMAIRYHEVREHAEDTCVIARLLSIKQIH